MKRTMTIIGCILATSLSCSAQLPPAALSHSTAAGSECWTIERCIAYALEHGASVRTSALQEASARNEELAARVAFLPSVAAQSSVQWAWGRNVSPETNSYNDITTFNNGYGLSASLTLFDGGRTINQWRMARAARRQSQTDLQVARDDKAFEVMQAFVDAAYMQGCVALAEEELRESEAMLRQTRTQEEIGLKGAPEVAQMQSRVAESEYNLTCQRNLLATAMMELKRRMSMPANEELEISAELDSRLRDTDASIASKPQSLDSAPLFGTAHSRLLSAKEQLAQSRYSYLASRSAVLPSLSLFAGLSTNYFRSLTGNYEVPAFASQLKNNLGEYVGLSLSIPLFSSSTLTSARRARLNLRRARIDYDETLLQLDNTRRQAILDLDAIRMEIEKMRAKVSADQTAYRLNARLYDEGLLSAIDLQASANQLMQSRLTLLQKQMLIIIKQKLVEYYGPQN